jgi:hypothetical protein
MSDRGRILPSRHELHKEIQALRFIVEGQKRVIESLHARLEGRA